jgi:hypothetical protein
MSGHAVPDRGFRVAVARFGIVRLSWAPGLRITGSLAAAAMAAVDELNGERSRPLLVEMAGADTPTREARTRFEHPCTAYRIALLGRSAVDRVRATSGVGGRGFPVPTRFFTSEPAALAWLLGEAADDLPL